MTMWGSSREPGAVGALSSLCKIGSTGTRRRGQEEVSSRSPGSNSAVPANGNLLEAVFD